MVAPLSRSLPPLASRPALVVVALALGGFLVDLFVRPVSTEGFLLILLAASPFLLELLPPAPQSEEIADKAGTESPPLASARPAPKSPASVAPRPVEPPRTDTPRAVATRPAPAAPRETAGSGPRPVVRPSQPEPSRPAAARSRETDAPRPTRLEPEKLL